MKKTGVLIYVFLLGFLLASCEKDDGNDIVIQDDSIIVLPDITEKTGESLIYDSNQVDNGYILVNEVTNGRVYLIEKQEGGILYEWDLPAALGNDAELLPDGKLLVALKVKNPHYNIGGYGGRVQIINPDGSIDWNFEYSSASYLAHHDVELLPNGNILILVWESKTKEESKQAGYADSNNIEVLLPESLIEINPVDNNIVWEWHAWNHLIQDFDDTKDNFGVISENPQLIDVNFTTRANGDIMHINGMDYDTVNDVIYLSVNFYNEVWVIDHSTTTQEAATNMGGNLNKGGDLIYRFGNPMAYNNTEGSQLFFNNHFPNILEGNQVGSGGMLIYMNGNINRQSKVFELNMPNGFSLLPNHDNEPEVLWEFTDSDLYSPILGGVERLPNGNTLIAEPGYGFWEVTTSGEVVWKFKNDVLVWRGYSYTKDDPAIKAIGL